MLRINLLPPYIYDRQNKLKLIALCSVGLAVIVVFFGLWYGHLSADLAAQKDDQSKHEALKGQYDLITAHIASIKQKGKDASDKQGFVANARAYDDGWSQTFNEMRDLTSNDIRLKSMQVVGGSTVSITAFASDESQIIAWWASLRNHSGIFQKVSFGLPEHPWPPGSASSGMGGSGGMRGMPGSGGMGGSGGMRGMPGSGGMGGSGGMRGMPGSGGMGGSGGRQSDDIGPGIVEGRPVINFTAELVLKTPLANGVTLPVWNGSSPAPAAAPAFGGAPGMGGPAGAPRGGRGPSSAG